MSLTLAGVGMLGRPPAADECLGIIPVQVSQVTVVDGMWHVAHTRDTKVVSIEQSYLLTRPIYTESRPRHHPMLPIQTFWRERTLHPVARKRSASVKTQ